MMLTIVLIIQNSAKHSNIHNTIMMILTSNKIVSYYTHSCILYTYYDTLDTGCYYCNNY